MKIDEKWLTGFIETEGYFCININKSVGLVDYQIVPEFKIIQHKKDIQLLYAIKKFFRYGSISSNISENSSIFEYKIRKFENLRDVIVPFFEKNSLLTKKKFDFISFRKVILIMEREDHLKDEGLKKIIKIKEDIDENKEIYFEEKLAITEILGIKK
ncbi:MAG TPA: LAGLIDADG family homing endonuclease [Mycoplasmatales bacterium]|jgi:hypothetical protein|nr:LAGLIDADG family homing endonuclease [Mycoplasmatales bacterium]